MKISFDKNELSRGLNIVMKAVPPNTTMPLLKCVLIDASSNDIKLMSNDMELAIETKVSGTAYEKGIIALDAKIFYEIVRKLPDGIVDIEVNDRYTANIKCGKAVFNIPGQDGTDFPYPPEIEKDYSLGMSQFTLKEMIRETIFSLNLSEKNKLMTGEMFEIKNNTLRIVSLDGHRIAIRRIKLGMEHENRKAIVPGKSLNEISKILSDNIEDQVNIYFTDNLIMFEFDDTCVYSRLIEGDYFHVDNMISADFQTKVEIDKKEFFECLDRASLLVKEGENKPIILNIVDGYMEMSINTSFGSMNETIEIEKEGNDLRIGFNPRFLTDSLKVIDDEKIKIYLLNRKAPCYIKDDEENYIYLILPVNIL
jgi:DNA polymerase-3 subunit beta